MQSPGCPKQEPLFPEGTGKRKSITSTWQDPEPSQVGSAHCLSWEEGKAKAQGSEVAPSSTPVRDPAWQTQKYKPKGTWHEFTVRRQGGYGGCHLPPHLWPRLLGQGGLQQLKDAAHQVQAASDQHVNGASLLEDAGPAAGRGVGKEAP